MRKFLQDWRELWQFSDIGQLLSWPHGPPGRPSHLRFPPRIHHGDSGAVKNRARARVYSGDLSMIIMISPWPLWTIEHDMISYVHMDSHDFPCDGWYWLICSSDFLMFIRCSPDIFQGNPHCIMANPQFQYMNSLYSRDILGLHPTEKMVPSNGALS